MKKFLGWLKEIHAPRALGAVAAYAAIAASKALGVEVTPEVVTAAALYVYGLVHKAASAKVNPADTATTTPK